MAHVKRQRKVDYAEDLEEVAPGEEQKVEPEKVDPEIEGLEESHPA